MKKSTPSSRDSMMGRPTGKRHHTEDSVFTDEVIKILMAYLQYTQEAGKLRCGFYASENPSVEVDERVELPGFVLERHRSRMSALILRMRFAMDRRAADEFETIFLSTYQLLQAGSTESKVAGDLSHAILNNQVRFPFLTLAEPDLQAFIQSQKDIAQPLGVLLNKVVKVVNRHIRGRLQ